MESPPSYNDVCRTERDIRPQQVTLALVLPPNEDDQTSQNRNFQEEKCENQTEVQVAPPPYQYLTPCEPPPKYTDVEDEELVQKLRETGLLPDDSSKENTRLGGDLIFTLAFLIAFIFNWIGYIFAYCLSMSMAGRHGALAGFGASMVKWSLIAMNSVYYTEYFKRSPTGLLVVLLICGILIFVRGVYLHIKMKYSEGDCKDAPIEIVYKRM